MRSYWIRQALILYDFCPCTKKRGRWSGKGTPCEAGGRNWSEASASEGTPKMASVISTLCSRTRSDFLFKSAPLLRVVSYFKIYEFTESAVTKYYQLMPETTDIVPQGWRREVWDQGVTQVGSFLGSRGNLLHISPLDSLGLLANFGTRGL